MSALIFFQVANLTCLTTNQIRYCKFSDMRRGRCHRMCNANSKSAAAGHDMWPCPWAHVPRIRSKMHNWEKLGRTVGDGTCSFFFCTLMNTYPKKWRMPRKMRDHPCLIKMFIKTIGDLVCLALCRRHSLMIQLWMCQRDHPRQQFKLWLGSEYVDNHTVHYALYV